ncbi:uncharacterized protein METZ01_LOCUS334398, partial [marine metagenome]
VCNSVVGVICVAIVYTIIAITKITPKTRTIFLCSVQKCFVSRAIAFILSSILFIISSLLN